MIYLDSNVFIYYVISDEKTEEKALLSKNILVKVAEGKLDAATSSVTWDEVVWSVKKISGSDIAKIEGKKFLEFPNLKILNVDANVIIEAQKVLEKYNLKPRDSIHAACAIKNNMRQIITDDPDFDKVAGLERILLEKSDEI